MELEALFENFERPAQLDIKLNFKKFFESENFDDKQRGLITLACAETVNCAKLARFAEHYLKSKEASDEEIHEAKDVAAIMGIANNYYRFRHFVKKEDYQKAAGFRMSLMMKPVTGKLHLEMMSLAVSIINGCETCVEGHEKSMLEHGGSTAQVHDLARLASSINGLAICLR